MRRRIHPSCERGTPGRSHLAGCLWPETLHARHGEASCAGRQLFGPCAEVDRNKKIGTQGYCMGGPLVVKTAATVPNRVGAGASFHGGGLVTTNPDSPH